MKKYIIGALSVAMLCGVFSLTNTKTEVKAKETKSVTVTKIVSAKDNKATESYKIDKTSLGQALVQISLLLIQLKQKLKLSRVIQIQLLLDKQSYQLVN